MTIEKWEIDSSHSGIHFSVRHLVIAKVRGQFARWSGTITAQAGDPSSGSVSVVIDTSSIDTGVADRDAHLKSADFLDVAQFPEITFNSTRVEKAKDRELKIVGQLSIRGISREVVLVAEYAGSAKDPWGNERAGFAAKTAIDRKEFGLTWNQALEAGGVLVGERIDIELEVEAVKQVATKVA